jgi:hypothetical protein
LIDVCTLKKFNNISNEISKPKQVHPNGTNVEVAIVATIVKILG